MATTIQINGKTAFITPTGFRIGSKGKVVQPSAFYASLPNKSQRRQLRKAAHAAGFFRHASAPTAA